MRKARIFGLRFLLFGIVGTTLIGLVTMGLWNWLLPVILGVRAINFGQALGLLVLSRILFGRFGGWGRRLHRARFVRGWKDLTPEQKERFRQATGSSRPAEFGAS